MVDPATDTEAEPDTQPVYEILPEKLGDADANWLVFDPRAQDEPVRGSLTEDLYEVYGELKKVFAVAQEGAFVSEQIWEARLGFQSHGGWHAVDAMRPIYWILYH